MKTGQKDNKTISVDILALFGGKAPDCPEDALTMREIAEASGRSSYFVDTMLTRLVKDGTMAVATKYAMTRTGCYRRVPAYYVVAENGEL